jgi:crotonobetainyl-CoA:carnitine CoA-transferase CaiB-like acyl-CoA transferase
MDRDVEDERFPGQVGRHRCLEGYVIVDLTQYLSGPFCTAILAALGATVLKVEPPETGDGNRRQPPFVTAEGLRATESHLDDIGLAFLKRNPCKLSLALDVRSSEGHAVLLRLIRRADACVHNFRPGVAERLRLDAERLRAVNPRLVYCGIEGLGAWAPAGDRRGVMDIIGQALSGLMAFTGTPEGVPTRSAAPVADQVAGLFAAIAILAGLIQRDGGRSTGVATVTSVSMLGALGALVWDEHHDVYHRQGLPERCGNGTPRIVPFNTYETADGKYVAISCVSEQEWARLVEATGIAELRQREDWRRQAARVRDRDAIDRLLAGWIRGRTRSEVMARLARHQATAAPVYGIEDILGDPRYVRAVLYAVQDPRHGPVDALGARFPIVVDGFQAGPYERAAPALGADTRQVLRDWAGLDDDEIARLAAAGIVRGQPREGRS